MQADLKTSEVVTMELAATDMDTISDCNDNDFIEKCRKRVQGKTLVNLNSPKLVAAVVAMAFDERGRAAILVDRLIPPERHGAIVHASGRRSKLGGAMGHTSSTTPCSLTNQVLAQLDLLNHWKGAKAHRNDSLLLKKLDEKVATSNALAINVRRVP